MITIVATIFLVHFAEVHLMSNFGSYLLGTKIAGLEFLSIQMFKTFDKLSNNMKYMFQ